jgi:hypothetical protein
LLGGEGRHQLPGKVVMIALGQTLQEPPGIVKFSAIRLYALTSERTLTVRVG